MMHTYLYRTTVSVLMLLGLVMTLFIGLWTFSIYSWVYKSKPEAEIQIDIPEAQVFGANQKVEVVEALPADQNTDPRNTELFDKKVAEVRRFLDGYGAPVAAHAEDFVRAAETYGIDYRLMPSISIVESTGGKRNFRKYNPFGWGKSGYPNYTVAIYDVARGLARYYARGAKTPEAISKNYNPVTPNAWAGKVRKLTSKMAAL